MRVYNDRPCRVHGCENETDTYAGRAVTVGACEEHAPWWAVGMDCDCADHDPWRSVGHVYRRPAMDHRAVV